MSSRLKNFITTNFKKVLAEDTVNSLGDRSKYIGASDISGCLRKAYLGKVEKVEYTIEQLIIFERGHLAEDMVAKMIRGTPLSSQVEIESQASNGFPIKAHIDFNVDWGNELVVIEAKSTDIPVDVPYDGWLLQTNLQMKLLQKKYPQKEIRGYVMALNVNTGWHESFDVEQNDVFYELAMKKANILADAVVNRCEPEGEVQLYCTKCEYKGNCPAITKMTTENLPKDVVEVVKKLAAKTAVEKEIKVLKRQLQEFMESTGIEIAKADNHTVSLVKNRGKKSADIELLKKCAPDVYAQVECYSGGYSYVKVV